MGRMGTGTRARSISTRTCSEALGCKSAGRRRVKTKRENGGVDLGDEHYSRRMCDGVVMLTNTAHASGRKRSIPLPWLSFCIEEDKGTQNESHDDIESREIERFRVRPPRFFTRHAHSSSSLLLAFLRAL